jgi:uracil-DNA glycosylase
MLVGQAPGQSEAVDRRPFIGRAGRTLFRWMARAGISEGAFREHVYIAAVTRCYPGPHPSGRGDRVPSPRERALCAPWLDAELAAIRPALVIPVGRLAIERFVGAAPLDQLVGRALAADHPGGRTAVIPLPHPSGASSWIHAPGHPELLDRALALLGGELARLGVADGVAERSAGAARRSVA